MNVQATKSWGVQHFFGQDQAIGCDDRSVGIERCEGCMFCLVAADARRSSDFDAQRFGGFVHGLSSHLFAPTCGAMGVRIDCSDFMACVYKGVGCLNVKIRRVPLKPLHRRICSSSALYAVAAFTFFV